MLKFENLANVGDMIKAFDFKPMADRPDYFLTGIVLDKGMIKHPVHGFDMYMAYTVKIVGQGEDNQYEIGEIAYVPFETDFMEYDERVQLVATKEEVEMVMEAA
jgi:hypothetical protein